MYHARKCKFVTSPSSASTSAPEGPDSLITARPCHPDLQTATNARHFARNKAKLGGDGVVK